MIVSFKERDFPAIEKWDELQEDFEDKAIELLPDVPNIKRLQLLNAFQREYVAMSGKLFSGSARWGALTAYIFQAAYTHLSDFREIVDTTGLNKNPGSVVLSNLLILEDGDLSDVQLVNLYKSWDWYFNLIMYRWLLNGSLDRERYSYVNWAFSLARESGVEDRGDLVLESKFDDKIGNVDVSYTGGLHFTLALGPLQMSRGWFTEIVSMFPGRNKDINVINYFGALACLPWYGYALMEALYMRRNYKVFPSLRLFNKTALFNEDPKSVKIRDAWFNSFWTLQPGLLQKGGDYTISKPDYLANVYSQIGEYFDFTPWDGNIYSFAAAGPFAKGFNTTLKDNLLLYPFADLPLKGTSDYLLEIIKRSYNASLSGLPIGGRSEIPDNINIEDEIKTLIDGIEGAPQSYIDYQEEKKSQINSTPLFINYLKIIK